MTHVSRHLATTMSIFHVRMMYYKLVRSLHAYVADESRNFNPKLGCNKYLY